MAPAKLLVETIVSYPFAENTFVARLEGRDDCIIVDPGLEPERILDFTEESGLRPAGILCTHRHGDHVSVTVDVQPWTG